MASKVKSPGPAKRSTPSTKPSLKIKPSNDLEVKGAQSDKVRGGVAGPGKLFSDAALKNRLAPIKGALAKLHGIQF